MFLQSKQPCTKAVEVVNVTFWQRGGESLILQRGWWMSGVLNVWGGELRWWWMFEVVNIWGGWMSEVVNVWFYTGGGERLGWWMSWVVNVWGGERLRWWTSGVVNVWFYTGGGERLRWWTSGVVNVWVVNVLQSRQTLKTKLDHGAFPKTLSASWISCWCDLSQMKMTRAKLPKGQEG